MTSTIVTDAKALATSAIQWLTSQVGQQLVSDVYAVLTMESPGELIEDVSTFAASILRGAIGILDDAAIKAAIAAENLAVDKAVDALEAAEVAAKP
jgi:hypothetical protein